jgi:hypothetical protein
VSDRTDAAIAVLVMAAVGLVLGAPMLGRRGLPELADLAMLGAAACGVGSFVLAGLHTLRAARAGRASKGEGGGGP